MGQGQNLVPNPSFEIYDTCPTFSGRMYASNWYVAEKTPDYFNVCTTTPAISIPNNLFDLQFPATGNAYCGFYTYGTVDTLYREKIGVQLLSPLNIGTRYFVSFKLNATSRHVNGATNKTGALFSTTSYTPAHPSPTKDFCQVWSDSIITDTINWVQIRGSFIADSAYSYLTLGNFFVNSHTDTARFWGTSISLIAYYYIDDVCVSNDSSTCNSPVGIREAKQIDDVKISPNPFSSQLTFSLSNNEQVTLSLYNFLGQQILQQTFTSSATINTAELATGIYFYELRNGKAAATTGKAVKQ